MLDSVFTFGGLLDEGRLTSYSLEMIWDRLPLAWFLPLDGDSLHRFDSCHNLLRWSCMQCSHVLYQFNFVAYDVVLEAAE